MAGLHEAVASLPPWYARPEWAYIGFALLLIALLLRFTNLAGDVDEPLFKGVRGGPVKAAGAKPLTFFEELRPGGPQRGTASAAARRKEPAVHVGRGV